MGVTEKTEKGEFVKANRAKGTLYFFTLVIILLQFGSCERLTQTKKHTDIVLIGGMGDLSKKYLHFGFYSLISKHTEDNQSFSYYPSGRTIAEETEPLLRKILTSKINCDETDEICEISKNSFLKVTNYIQLKTDDDYHMFCDALKLKWKNMTEANVEQKIDVIFYLSIPSSGYLSTAQYINKHCRMRHKDWKLKVVMEKPFGHDRSSAQQMGSQLSDTFSEEEMYRVDHYLGKTIAREILTFRRKNDAVEALLNQNHVERVEVFMKESIGVKGRIEFYDQTGVIKDVFQNHLTELLNLVAMEIPKDLESSAAIKDNKLKLLRQIEPVKMSATLLGQYSGYMKEAEQEGAQLSTSKFTPTFAATMLQINSPRWDGVPFLLVGGKKLDERSGYVRVVFKRNRVCPAKCSDKTLEQLVFHIGHGEVSSPAILMSRSLGEPVWPQGFTPNSSKTLPSSLYGQQSYDISVAFPAEDPDAYTVLIEDLFLGVQDKFIGTDHLLALWDIWSDVATRSASVVPRLYNAGDMEQTLAFRFTHNKLEFLNSVNESVVKESDPKETRQTPSTYLGHKLITSDRQKLAYLLAADIADSITEKLQVSRVYHIALSGGNSPSILFEMLAQHFASIPWKHVHIWQVDERCVPPNDKDSNFRQLENHLLRHIRIPHFNIHPMPVDIAGKLCSVRDNGIGIYQELLHDQVSRGFDYIVLGVGSDGHTASVFPNSQAVKETINPVALTDKLQGPDNLRMTLTLPFINRARQVSVLVIGKEKQSILKELEEEEGSVSLYPILGVNPRDGVLTWFIDEDALP